jgi:hypothetical protein
MYTKGMGFQQKGFVINQSWCLRSYVLEKDYEMLTSLRKKCIRVLVGVA